MENPGDRRRSNFLIDKDPHMVFEDIISLQARLSERDPWAFPAVFTNARRPRSGRLSDKRASHSAEDADLLVLLAEQEIAAGRKEQAGCLIDAASVAFDRRILGR
jgi:hypothetical protein